MNTREMLKGLEKLIRQGALTKSEYADYGTYICAVDKAQNTYHQFEFESLPRETQKAFKHQKVGAMLGHVKIVAIFDAWPDAVVGEPVAHLTLPKDS